MKLFCNVYVTFHEKLTQQMKFLSHFQFFVISESCHYAHSVFNFIDLNGQLQNNSIITEQQYC